MTLMSDHMHAAVQQRVARAFHEGLDEFSRALAARFAQPMAPLSKEVSFEVGVEAPEGPRSFVVTMTVTEHLVDDVVLPEGAPV